jgi:hypothetical protein
MAESSKNKIGIKDYKKLSRQNNLLFVAGVVSVLAGLFFPKIPAFVDLLMIFSLALSAAVIVICLCSRKPAELTGLPLLAVTAVAALLTATIASAKLAIIENTAGLIITYVAQLNIIANILPAPLSAVIFAIVSVVLFIVAAKSTRKLLLSSKTYLEEATSVEQTQSEFNLVATDSEQENLTAKEKGFFYAAHAFGRLAVWLCVLISSVVMLSLFGTALVDKTLVSLAAASGIFLQGSAFLVALAVSHLTRKIALQSSQRNRMTEEQFQQRIKVVAREVAAAQTDNRQPVTRDPAAVSCSSSDEFLFDCNEFENEASYDSMTNLLTESGAGAVLLMAACGSQYAPVTIPVNVAVRLATRGLKTLIIDFDLERSAVQQVFETGNCDSRAVKTCIENISLISGKRLASAKPQTLRQLFAKAEKIYDYILVYAPDAALPQQMSEFFTAAIFFGSDNTPTNPLLARLIEELGTTPCQVFTPGLLLQPA